MTITLPADILYLICLELGEDRDFNTLFNCCLSSKELALHALACLYRLHNVSPVTYGGGDELELSRRSRIDHKNSAVAQEETVKKWAMLWRSLILSSMGRTFFPYCRYIRVLNLNDLGNLFEDRNFRGKVEKSFFAGELAKFHREMDTPRKRTSTVSWYRRLDARSAIDAIALTHHTPNLEDLSGDILPSALPRWAARLPRLQSLSLWHGSALSEGAEDSFHAHCPLFRSLSFYEWQNDQADHLLAEFLRGIRPQSLELLEIFSFSDIGGETFLALNSQHQQSLKQLRLSSLKTEAIIALPLLKDCQSIQSLLLNDVQGFPDLEQTQNDIFLEMISWLKGCKDLQDVSLKPFRNAPAIITPILLQNDIHLKRLEVEGYAMRDSREFHQALREQQNLQILKLKGDPEIVVRDDIDALIDSLTQLRNLRDLQLSEISDYFRDEHICQLARSLPNLEEFQSSGFGITDAVWGDIARLERLRVLYFSAMTSFTFDGILDYISLLGAGNKGLTLSVMNADPDSNLSDDEQAIINETIVAKVEGRFDFVLMRDPDLSEFEGDSD